LTHGFRPNLIQAFQVSNILFAESIRGFPVAFYVFQLSDYLFSAALISLLPKAHYSEVPAVAYSIVV
jgi:hypothetical protein